MDMIYQDVNHALPNLASRLRAADELGSRAGRVREEMHNHIVIERPINREVLVQGRGASLPAQIAETMWVLSGRNDVAFLSHYLPRAAEFSDDGKVWRGGYGPRIRSAMHSNAAATPMEPVDQLKHVLDLLQRDHTSRRAVIGIYDGADDSVESKDIPCNDLLVFSSRLGKLDLSVHTRSNDLVWGWSGINQFEWSVLQEIVAGLLGLTVGKTHYHIVSLHMYDRHWEKSEGWKGLVQTAEDALKPSPRFDAEAVRNNGEGDVHSVLKLDGLFRRWFILEDRIRVQGSQRPGLQGEIEDFPEPMMRSWLYVLNAWWNGAWLPEDIRGTRLEAALELSPKRKTETAVEQAQHDTVSIVTLASNNTVSEFIDETSDLHVEKSQAYGDSWKRRGELLGILANVARKIDRLGVTDEHETSADTAQDLLVYLVKYRLWLKAHVNGTEDFSDVDGAVRREMMRVASIVATDAGCWQFNWETWLKTQFDALFTAVQDPNRQSPVVSGILNGMERVAFLLAFHLWLKAK